MITENRLNIDMDNLYEEGQALAHIKQNFTLSINSQADTIYSVQSLSGHETLVSINKEKVEPLSSGEGGSGIRSFRYPLSLGQGEYCVAVKHTLPIKKRTSPRLVLSRLGYIYTLYYDFTSLRKFGIADNTQTEIYVRVSDVSVPYIPFLCGPCYIRFGSKSRDEERGILHTTKTRRSGKGVLSVLKIPYSVPDQLAVSAGVKGFL